MKNKQSFEKIRGIALIIIVFISIILIIVFSIRIQTLNAAISTLFNETKNSSDELKEVYNTYSSILQSHIDLIGEIIGIILSNIVSIFLCFYDKMSLELNVKSVEFLCPTADDHKWPALCCCDGDNYELNYSELSSCILELHINFDSVHAGKIRKIKFKEVCLTSDENKLYFYPANSEKNSLKLKFAPNNKNTLDYFEMTECNNSLIFTCFFDKNAFKKMCSFKNNPTIILNGSIKTSYLLPSSLDYSNVIIFDSSKIYTKV